MAGEMENVKSPEAPAAPAPIAPAAVPAPAPIRTGRRYYKPAKISSWRRMALAVWSPPDDPTINGIITVDAGPALKLIEKLRAEGTKVTITHLVGRAMALVMRKNPETNGKIIWRRIYLKETVDVFFQVDMGDGEDLSGVCIERADEKTLPEIARELEAKAQKLRKKQDEMYNKSQVGLARYPAWLLAPIMRFLAFLMYNLGIDLSRIGVKPDAFGSVMVTSMGMMGIDVGFAPLLPFARVPAIVLVGQCTDRAVVENGQIVIKPQFNICSTFDHRFMDGVQIAHMIRDFREYFRNPTL